MEVEPGALTQYEVEQKFRLPDVAAFESKLRELGVESFETVEQVDSYFAHPSRDFGETDEAFRLRRVGEKNFVTYKGPKIDTTTKTRREIELPLPAGKQYAEDFKLLIESLGFRLVGHVEKVRQKAQISRQGTSIEVAIDNVHGVGMYAELEVVAQESEVAAAKRLLASLASEVGLQQGERRSYLELLFERPS